MQENRAVDDDVKALLSEIATRLKDRKEFEEQVLSELKRLNENMEQLLTQSGASSSILL